MARPRSIHSSAGALRSASAFPKRTGPRQSADLRSTRDRTLRPDARARSDDPHHSSAEQIWITPGARGAALSTEASPSQGQGSSFYPVNKAVSHGRGGLTEDLPGPSMDVRCGAQTATSTVTLDLRRRRQQSSGTTIEGARSSSPTSSTSEPSDSRIPDGSPATTLLSSVSPGRNGSADAREPARSTSNSPTLARCFLRSRLEQQPPSWLLQQPVEQQAKRTLHTGAAYGAAPSSVVVRHQSRSALTSLRRPPRAPRPTRCEPTPGTGTPTCRHGLHGAPERAGEYGFSRHDADLDQCRQNRTWVREVRHPVLGECSAR